MLNEIAWRYLQSSPVVLTIITFAFIWLGGLLAVVRPRGTAVLNRAPYFALFGLVSLAFSIVQLMWIASGAAIIGGWLWFLAVLDAAVAIGVGYIVVTLGQARSRDIRSDPGLGFLGVVPIANLWLIFKPGQAAPEDVTPVSPLFVGVAGVVVGLAATVTARLIDAGAEDMVVTAIATRVATPEGGAAVYDLRIRTEGLPAVLRDEASMAGTPVSAGNGVTLAEVTANGNTLRFRFDLADGLAVEPKEAEPVVRKNACADAAQRVLLDHGARLEFAYRDAANVVVTIVVTGADCTI